MEIGKACAIFKNISGYECSAAEKYEAIYAVADMRTHNGFSKRDFIEAIKWMLMHPEERAEKESES